jgi:hypothetical protein
VKTIYITIGNSDDKLTQVRWSEFCKQLNDYTLQFTRHGAWSSDTWSPYQNACFCIEVPNSEVSPLRSYLKYLAAMYNQDSIAMAIAEMEFLKP